MSGPTRVAPGTPPLAFCTVATPAYLHQALVLAESLRAHEPEAELFVLVLHDDAMHAPGPHPFTVLGLEDLDIPDLERRASRYGIGELAMSLKARVMRTVMGRRGGPVCWLDADCAVYAPLDEFRAQVAGASVTLAPHLLEPLAADAGPPAESLFMLSGAYNTGVVGVDGSDEAGAFLDWWEGHLAREALLLPESGWYSDQTWAGLAPMLFPRARISRDVTIDVAHWNLPQRRLTVEDGAFRVDGEPLRIYHFSGFDPELPACASRYFPDDVAPEGSPLRALLADYAERLLAARAGLPPAPPAPFSTFPGGVPIDGLGRRLLRDAIDRGEVETPVYDGPAGVAAREWLLAPGTRPGGLSRWAEAFRAQTAAVRDAFPDQQRDGPRLVSWLRRTGAERYGIDPLLLHGPRLLAVTAPETAPAVVLETAAPADLPERLRALAATLPPGTPVVAAAPPGTARDEARAIAGDRDLVFAGDEEAGLAELIAAASPRDVAVVRAGAVLCDGWLEAMWDVAQAAGSVAVVVPVAVDGPITAEDADGVAGIASFGRTRARDLETPCVYLRRGALDLLGPVPETADAWPPAMLRAIRDCELDVLLADDVLVGGRQHPAPTPASRRAASIARGFTLALAPVPAADADAANERALLAEALADLLGSWFVDLDPAAGVPGSADVVLSLDGRFPASPPNVARVSWKLCREVGDARPPQRCDVLVAARAGAPPGPLVLPGLGSPGDVAAPATTDPPASGDGGGRDRFAAAVRALEPAGDAVLLAGEAGRTRAWALARAGRPVLVVPDVAAGLGLGTVVAAAGWTPAEVAQQLGALAAGDERRANAAAWAQLLAERTWSRAARQLVDCCRDALAVSSPPHS